MRNEFFHKLVFVIIGLVAGMCLTLSFHRSPSEFIEVPGDTVYVYKHHSFSASDFSPISLKVPQTKNFSKLVLLPLPSPADTVVKHDSVFIVLNREFKFLEKAGTKIWYSGVDPSIDSLYVTETIKTVPKYIYPEPKHHHLSITTGLLYFERFHAPVGLEYSYSPSKVFDIKASAGYDFFIKKPFVNLGADINLLSF